MTGDGQTDRQQILVIGIGIVTRPSALGLAASKAWTYCTYRHLQNTRSTVALRAPDPESFSLMAFKRTGIVAVALRAGRRTRIRVRQWRAVSETTKGDVTDVLYCFKIIYPILLHT
jgi:hypothetical protein